MHGPAIQLNVRRFASPARTRRLPIRQQADQPCFAENLMPAILSTVLRAWGPSKSSRFFSVSRNRGGAIAAIALLDELPQPRRKPGIGVWRKRLTPLPAFFGFIGRTLVSLPAKFPDDAMLLECHCSVPMLIQFRMRGLFEAPDYRRGLTDQ